MDVAVALCTSMRCSMPCYAKSCLHLFLLCFAAAAAAAAAALCPGTAWATVWGAFSTGSTDRANAGS